MSRYYMALGSAAHELVSSPRRRGRAVAFPVLWAAFLTLIVAGPWLAGGYWFGTDWPGPRHFDFPTEVSSSAPAQAALAALSWALSAEATGKLLVFGILLVAALTAYAAAPAESFLARAVAAAVFVFNPFVYGRLHYGQLFLLGAYAVLPWLASRMRRFLDRAGPVDAIQIAAGLTVIGAFSVHVFLIALVLAVIALIVQVVMAEARAAYLRRTIPWVAASAVGTAVGTAYWLVRLLNGQGPDAAALSAVGAGDLRAFASVPDPQLGLVPNLLGLYGFWAEGAGRFASMKSFVPFWPVALAALLLLCSVGAVVVLRRRNDRLAAWVVTLTIAGGLALLLDMGYAHPLTRVLVGWLDAAIGPYRGMRDAGKWAVLVALAYSQLAALGVGPVMDWIKERLPQPCTAEWAGGAAAGLLLALPIYYGNGLLYGMHGSVQPSEYPPGWYAADRALAADPHPERALFLPWHQYAFYSFVRNADAVISSPAPAFFSVPVLVSANAEVPGVNPPATPDQLAVTGLVSSGAQGHWAQVLAERGVKYILVAKELDWSSYSFLDSQAGLTRIGDYGSILLYRDDLTQ